MKKQYQIFYNGLFMGSHVTRCGAEAHVYRISKEKNWNILHIQIRTAVLERV